MRGAASLAATIKAGRAAGVFLLLLLAAFSMRYPFAGIPFFNVDEAHDAVGAHVILAGGIPYRDVAGHRGPLIYYLLAGVFALFGRFNMTPVHLSLSLLTAATAYLLYFFGRRIIGAYGGVIAALAFLYGSFNYRSTDTLAFHTEFPMIFCTTAAMLFLGKGWAGGRARHFFLSGALLGIAVLFKQAAFMDLGAALCAFGAALLFRVRMRAELCRFAIALAAGFGVIALLTVVFFAGLGAWKDFVDLFWNYNVRIYGPSTAISEKLKWAMTYPLHRKFFFGRNAVLSLCLAGFAGLFLRRLVRRKEGDKAVFMRDLFLGGWFCMAYGGASLSGRHFGHYYLQVLPPLCLITGVFLDALRESIPARFRKPAASTACVLAAMLFASSFMKIKSDPGLQMAYDFNEVSEYIQSSSGENDAIYVWGFVPHLYLMTQRRPASRYLVSNFMSGAVPFADNRASWTDSGQLPGAREIFMKDLRASSPLFILDTSPGDYYFYARYPLEKFEEFRDYLQRYYVLDRTFYESEGRPLRVYKRRDGGELWKQAG